MTTFNEVLAQNEMNLGRINQIIRNSDNELPLVQQLMSMIDMIGFETILLKCKKKEVVEFLILLDRRNKVAEIKKFLKLHDEKIREYLTELHTDVDSFFKTIPLFLEQEDFLH